MTAFLKLLENFVCEHCGARVAGNGFTNHCPHCLWSKHVDIDPGDRAEKCHGMMRPMRVTGSSPKYSIVQTCERCGTQRNIMAHSSDDDRAIVALAQETAG